MKTRDFYLKSATPVWDISHDTATAAFNFDVVWLFEIREACELLGEKRGANKDVYRTLLGIVTELHKVAERRKGKILQTSKYV